MKMKFLNKNLKNNTNLFFYFVFFSFILNQCSLISNSHIQKEVNSTTVLYNSVSSISFNGNININTPDKNGRLFTKFIYNTLDTLHIQFRDPIARKVALMKFRGDDFLLWLQRENKRFDMEDIPNEYSMFLLDDLSLNEIRKIFIGRPLFNKELPYTETKQDSIIMTSENGLKTVSFFAKNYEQIERINIYNNDTLSTIIEYEDYSKYHGLEFPSRILINGIYANYMLDIKLYHFSVELGKFVVAGIK